MDHNHHVNSIAVYEYPLNEKMRSWLRLETLLIQLFELRHIHSLASGLAFFRSVTELIDTLDRGEIRADLIKELDKQKKRLTAWLDVPNAETEVIQSLLDNIIYNAKTVAETTRFAQHLRQDKLINMVRQRLTIPGGCCGFDLPNLHLWLNLPQNERDIQIKKWLEQLTPLQSGLDVILSLARHSGVFDHKESHNGFFQDSVEEKTLVRIRLDPNTLIYPQISGHKTRFAIRFLHMDSEHGVVPEKLSFELACC